MELNCSDNEEKVQARCIQSGDTIQYPSSWLVTHKASDRVVPLQSEVLEVYTDNTYIAFKTVSGHIKGMNRQKHITRVKRSTLSAKEKFLGIRYRVAEKIQVGEHQVSIE